jgi:hypothetical protein
VDGRVLSGDGLQALLRNDSADEARHTHEAALRSEAQLPQELLVQLVDLTFVRVSGSSQVR